MLSNTYLIDFPWVILGAIWLVAAAGKKPTIYRQPSRNRILSMLILLFGFCLLAGPWFESGWMEYRFVPVSASVRITAFGLTWCGIVFSIWARLTLGGNWSGRPSLMAGHELITSGPYAIARHPIYTGLILAAAGTSLAVGELHSLLGFLLLILMFFFKIRAEEQIMLKAFPDAYPRYRSRVKALIPGML